MRQEKNIFGEGTLYEAADLMTPIYVLGCACSSIQSEMLSYANAHDEDFTLDVYAAESIVVLSCQVTDLAILNDIRRLKKLRLMNGGVDFYVGGCLARRFDIELPIDVMRLDHVRQDGMHLDRKNLIDWAPPFWVPGFDESNKEQDGHLFRDMYPLRIGVGCKGRCKYCSIRVTRGEPYQLDFEYLTKEFLSYDNVVLISDSPSVEQVKQWCELAIKVKKPFSIRNVEPQVFEAACFQLSQAAQQGVLNILHVPIQHTDVEVLRDMSRSVDSTIYFLHMRKLFQEWGVKIATNVIVSYKDFPDPDPEVLATFDYVSWNPYWDGVWDREKAEKRFAAYLPKCNL